MYKLEIAKSVEKDLKKINRSEIPKIISAIQSLQNNPFPINSYKKLKGSEKSFRLRTGNYRILYEVEQTIKLICVYRVRHRKDVYKSC